jgi:nucleoid-associated protein YgaU
LPRENFVNATKNRREKRCDRQVVNIAPELVPIAPFHADRKHTRIQPALRAPHTRGIRGGLHRLKSLTLKFGVFSLMNAKVTISALVLALSMTACSKTEPAPEAAAPAPAAAEAPAPAPAAEAAPAPAAEAPAAAPAAEEKK